MSDRLALGLGVVLVLAMAIRAFLAVQALIELGFQPVHPGTIVIVDLETVLWLRIAFWLSHPVGLWCLRVGTSGRRWSATRIVGAILLAEVGLVYLVAVVLRLRGLRIPLT